MNFSHSSVSKTGLKRVQNEDALGTYDIEDGLLIIVCDGLGGNKAGEVASQLTVDTIYKTFRNSEIPDYLSRIKKAITEANRMVVENSFVNSSLKGMATTVEVLFLQDNNAFWGHVGDSRIYFLGNGRLKQLTKDHSLVQKLIDDGFLTLKEAENHPNKNVIMRAIGDNMNVEIDISKMKINNGINDIKFLVCTDGVTSVVNDEEIEKILNENDIDVVKNKLSALIEERGAPDNFSFVVVKKNS